jgi:hypothetical protein
MGPIRAILGQIRAILGQIRAIFGTNLGYFRSDPWSVGYVGTGSGISAWV